jgi:ABC-type Na+ efflux pump permease subunit
VSRRADAIRRIGGWLVRGGLFAAWALAGWGTLLILVTLVGTVSDGPGVAFARLVPVPGAGLWAWLNSLSVLLALGVWSVALGLFLRSRRSAAGPLEPEP